MELITLAGCKVTNGKKKKKKKGLVRWRLAKTHQDKPVSAERDTVLTLPQTFIDFLEEKLLDNLRHCQSDLVRPSGLRSIFSMPAVGQIYM